MSMQLNFTMDDFDSWLGHMYYALQDFQARLPEEISTQLDYSVTSLDILEAWLLDVYPSMETALEPSQSLIIDGIARYIGETFRRNFGGQWTIELSDPKQRYAGLPILTGLKLGPLCPSTMVTSALDRRKGDYISTIFHNVATSEAE